MLNDREVRKALRTRPTYFVGTSAPVKVSKKKFREVMKFKKEGEYVKRSFVISTKMFTPKKLLGYEKSGVLKRVKGGRDILYPREQILNLIQSESTWRKFERG
jgi:hypothetical protein